MPTANIGGITIASEDVTARVVAEHALRDRERLLRAVTDNAAVGMVMLDRERRYTFVNPTYVRILGLTLTSEEMLGKTPAEVLAPIYASQIAPRLDRVFAGERVAYELARPFADAELKYYVVVYDPVHGGGALVTGVIVTIFDITERRRSEEEVRASQQRLKAIVDTAADAIVVIDDLGHIQSINPATERLFGYSPADLVGENVSKLMPEPDRTKHDSYLEAFLRTGKAKIIGSGREVEGRRKDGSVFPIDLSVVEWRLAEKRYFTGLMRDVTDRKKREKQVDHLLREVNHRAKNMLALVQAVAMQTAATEPTRFRRALRRAHPGAGGEPGSAGAQPVAGYSTPRAGTFAACAFYRSDRRADHAQGAGPSYLGLVRPDDRDVAARIGDQCRQVRGVVQPHRHGRDYLGVRPRPGRKRSVPADLDRERGASWYWSRADAASVRRLLRPCPERLSARMSSWSMRPKGSGGASIVLPTMSSTPAAAIRAFSPFASDKKVTTMSAWQGAQRPQDLKRKDGTNGYGRQVRRRVRSSRAQGQHPGL